jgi:hypothetical protein
VENKNTTAHATREGEFNAGIKSVGHCFGISVTSDRAGEDREKVICRPEGSAEYRRDLVVSITCRFAGSPRHELAMPPTT